MMYAAAAALAASQVAGGIAQSRQSKYNAAIYNQQSQQIDIQKSLEAGQYNREKRQLVGTSIATTAKSGLTLSGSPIAVMIDSLSQLEMDKQIGQYNLEVEKRYASSAADMYKRKARYAMTAGITNAFSTTLMSGFDYGQRAGWGSKAYSDPKGSYNVGYGKGNYPGGYKSIAF